MSEPIEFLIIVAVVTIGICAVGVWFNHGIHKAMERLSRYDAERARRGEGPDPDESWGDVWRVITRR